MKGSWSCIEQGHDACMNTCVRPGNQTTTPISRLWPCRDNFYTIELKIKGILGNVRSFLFSLPVVVAVVQTEEDSVISTEHKATQSNKTPLYCHAGRAK